MGSAIKQKCFVIMPISKTIEHHTREYWTKHYATFIRPLIESDHPLVAKRSAPLRGDILRQIITDLVTAPIAVADLTDANPNVYWELGVRQSFKHCTITIAEDGTSLPFDLSGKGTLFYFPNDHIKMEEFRTQFHVAIDDCLSNPDVPDSHVIETISGRGTLYQIITRDESLRKLDAVISEIESSIEMLQEAIRVCEENRKGREEATKKGKEPPAEFGYTTARFRLAAVEALVINRYIDADENFYTEAETCMNWLISVNDQLSAWLSNPGAVENWLLKAHEHAESLMGKLKKLVKEQQKALKTTI